MGIVLLHRERGSAALKDTQKVWLCAVPAACSRPHIPRQITDTVVLKGMRTLPTQTERSSVNTAAAAKSRYSHPRKRSLLLTFMWFA